MISQIKQYERHTLSRIRSYPRRKPSQGVILIWSWLLPEYFDADRNMIQIAVWMLYSSNNVCRRTALDKSDLISQVKRSERGSKTLVVMVCKPITKSTIKTSAKVENILHRCQALYYYYYFNYKEMNYSCQTLFKMIRKAINVHRHLLPML